MRYIAGCPCNIEMENLQWHDWALALTGAFILGVAKAGVKGIDVAIVVVMAFAFGSRASTGIIVPMLVSGDTFAVMHYNRHAQWKYVRQFLPWAIIGVLIGVYFGKDLPEDVFKQGMAIIILTNVVVMFWWERNKSDSVPTHWPFATGMGLSAGFATMVGNLAGGFANLFFLAMRIPKEQFIGTAAWLFLIMNLCKTPFHLFVWNTINSETLLINLYLLPGIILGIIVGIKLVRRIQEGSYRKLILLLTTVGAIFIFFK